MTKTLMMGPAALAIALALGACSKEEAAAPPATNETAAPAEGTGAETAAAQGEAAAAPAPSFDDPKLQAGYDVFQKWCAPCHAPGPGHPGTQALAVKYADGSIPAELEARTDLTPELTIFFVRNGVSVMPPFRKTEITDIELDALAAYLARPR